MNIIRKEETKMAGKAYNPKMFDSESEHHECFNNLPQEAVEAYRTARSEGSDKTGIPDKWTYEKLWEMRKAKRSGQIGHFIFEMFYDIYMGVEDELVENSIDTQVRLYPDYVPRSNDILEYAVKASQAKMRAFISQDHFFPTFGQAWCAQQKVDEMVQQGQLEQACQCLGAQMLAWSQHPDQVHLASKYPNVGAILLYCQTYGGKNCGPALNVVDENGKLDSELKEVLRLCAHYKIPLMSGHAAMSYDRILPMAQYASEVGANLLWMHAAPWTAMPERATLQQYRDLVRLGCYLQVDANKVLPSIIWPMIDPNQGLEWMAELGPDHIIPCTDGGQPFFGDALDCWKMFVRAMIHYGIKKEDIKTMIQRNPAKLLYLDEQG
ncbi:MAG: hypothetical protein JXA46_09395 [Dehalococcoidales bacterium]|nr:hypothetical protein [Dehalococcoidales bacterium]